MSQSRRQLAVGTNDYSTIGKSLVASLSRRWSGAAARVQSKLPLLAFRKFLVQQFDFHRQAGLQLVGERKIEGIGH